MPKYKPEDYPVGAKFVRVKTETDYSKPHYDPFADPFSGKYSRPRYGTKLVRKTGVLVDPATAPEGSRTPRLGGALFGPKDNPYVYVKWDSSGLGSAFASEVTVEKPSPEEIRKQAEALLDNAGYTLIAIDKVANATKLSFNEGVLRLAGIHGKEVEFRYTKTDTAPVEQRHLLVESVESHGDVILVGGKDPDRGEYRNFRLDRIKGEVRFA